jgi:hypothetical protein
MHIPQAIIPLALSAYTAVTKTMAPAVRHTAEVTTLGSQTTVDQFADNDCAQYVNTIFITNPGQNGGCNQVDGTKSIRVTGVQDGCSGKYSLSDSCIFKGAAFRSKIATWQNELREKSPNLVYV